MIIHTMGESGCGLYQINPVEGRQVAQYSYYISGYQVMNTSQYLAWGLSMGALGSLLSQKLCKMMLNKI